MSDQKTVLVTGGAGYVGSHTCKILKKNGFSPITYDNLGTGFEWAVQWGPLVKGDLHDTALLIKTIQEHKPCVVLHFAAHTYVGESVDAPLKYYRNNVGGSISLLNAMNEAGLDKLVFSSTCAIYGVPEGKLLIETSAKNPINPYGNTKYVIEQILADLAKHKKLNYIALRYFNAAGADPDNEIGEAHEPETHLIPLAVKAALGQGAGLKIFGSDFPTADGTPIRDYIHVTDLATAHVLAVKHLLAGKGSDAFNLGTGKGLSVLEVIEGLQKLGLRVPAEKTGRRAGDPPQLVADAKKANSMLGWKPEMSDLATILSTAVAWHRKHDGK